MACIGWNKTDAEPLYSLMATIRVGDIIYIKAHPPQIGLIIKAVGVVTDARLRLHRTLNYGIKVSWVWSGEERLGHLNDKYPVRNITLYEEHNSKVAARVISLLLSQLSI